MLRLFALLILLTGCQSIRPVNNFSSGRRPPQFVWPVKNGKLTQKFHAQKKHAGLDLAARQNTPIFAAAPGKVIYTGRDFTGFGNLVIIEHSGPSWASFYAHLNSFKVFEGQWVNAGQKIGLMGKTGNATGPHLHFEIRKNRQPVNPLHFLP